MTGTPSLPDAYHHLWEIKRAIGESAIKYRDAGLTQEEVLGLGKTWLAGLNGRLPFSFIDDDVKVVVSWVYADPSRDVGKLHAYYRPPLGGAEREKVLQEVENEYELRKARARKNARDTLAAEDAAVQGAEPVDVAAIIAAGRIVGAPPSVMPFVDEPDKPSIGLFYPGCYNKLFGASDVGKSKILYATMALHVNEEKHVVHLEFDGNHPSVPIWGVVDAGADPELVATYLHVFEMPAETPVLPDDVDVALVTLDSENPVITNLGHDINASGAGVDLMLQRFITPFTSRGATAVGLDHVGHQDKTRERHTARKKEAVTGISYRVEVHGEPGRVGERWLSKLTPAKDRPGWGPPRDRVAGYAVIDGTANDGTYQVTLHRTPPLDLAARVAERDERRRLTDDLQLTADVSALVKAVAAAAEPSDTSGRSLRLALGEGWGTSKLAKVIDTAIQRGYLQEYNGPRNAKLQRLTDKGSAYLAAAAAVEGEPGMEL